MRLFSGLSQHRSKKSTRPHRRIGRRLGAEMLEDRRMMAQLHGGEGSTWDLADGAFAIVDALVSDHPDAFFTAGLVSVDGSTYLGGPVTTDGNLASYGAQTLSGLEVSGDIYVARSTATARQRVQFTNPTDGPITATVVFSGILGSGDGTLLNAFDGTPPRYIVTDDDVAGTAGDPAVTTVFYGLGDIALTPTSSQQMSQNYDATFELTVPAGQTRALMFFHQIHPTSAAAINHVGDTFNINPVLGNDLLAGITQGELNQVVNWEFSTPTGPVLYHSGEDAIWRAESSNPFNVNASGIDATLFSINGTEVTTGTRELSGNRVTTTALAPIAGLNVSQEVYFATSSATSRQLINLTNPTPGSISVQVEVSTNLGSDNQTQIITTSDTDTTFETSDRWIVTDNSDTTGGASDFIAAVTNVVAGWGSPEVLPSTVNNPETDPAPRQGFVTTTYDVTIPAGQTRRLMLLRQLNRTAAEAQNDASNFFFFNSLPVIDGDLLDGLSETKLDEIVNFDFDGGLGQFPLTGGQGSTWTTQGSRAGLNEAAMRGSSNTFDGQGSFVSVDGAILSGPRTTSGSTVNYVTQDVAGLNTAVQIFVAPSSATAREVVTLTNPTAAPITVPVVLGTDFDADGNTQITTTSNNNTTLEAVQDRFVVFDDQNLTGGMPAVTMVLRGANPSVLPTAMTPLDSDGRFTTTYNVTVPPGASQSLMFFWQLNQTDLEARIRDHHIFNSSTAQQPQPGNDMLKGMTRLDLARVVNWDYEPSLSVGSVTVTEGTSSSSIAVLSLAVFDVTLSHPTGQPVTVQYRTVEGSGAHGATAGEDYTSTSGTLTFAPGDTLQRITVPIATDAIAERDESFLLFLSNPTGALLDGTFQDDDMVALGTIANDDFEIVTGPDFTGSSHVRVVDPSGVERLSFFAYPGFFGGVRVATGDVNGDGVSDIITSPGPGGGPHIKAFHGESGQEIRSFFAYDPGFTGGAYVASADIDGDGKADIITSAGQGGGPHVKVFSGATGEVIRDFFAYDPGFTGGVRVAAGTFSGSNPDIITSPGPGGGPHVKVFSGTSLGVIHDFFAYDAGFTGGVYVAAGDINGDGTADVITGAGEGGGPHVKVFSGSDASEIRSFFAYGDGFFGGVRVGSGDMNGDGRADIIVSPGPGGGPHVRSFSGIDTRELTGFFAYGDFQGGVFVAGTGGASAGAVAPLMAGVRASSGSAASLTQEELALIRAAGLLQLEADDPDDELLTADLLEFGIRHGLPVDSVFGEWQ